MLIAGIRQYHRYAELEGPLMLSEHYDKRFDPTSGEGGLEIWVPLAG